MAEGDQLRVSDYIAMDCRRATLASVANNTLTLTVPAYYDSSGVAQDPSFGSNGAIQYGAGGTVTIVYAQDSVDPSKFDRSVTKNGTTTTTTIARNVASFTVSPIDLTTSLSCTIMFFPTFTRNIGSGIWRSGPTAPVNTTGVDGDYYVIDPTASPQTTIGDVYFRSNGSYSLLKNIKATTIYCNTFFRNPGARQAP